MEIELAHSKQSQCTSLELLLDYFLQTHSFQEQQVSVIKLRADQNYLQIISFPPSTLLNNTFQFSLCKIINLSTNNLKTFPQGLQYLIQLEELYLNSNQITNANLLELSPLQKLKIIDLKCNQLTQISEIPLLNSLESLSLSNNKLKEFPKFRETLNALQFLGLFGNDIQISDFEPIVQIIQSKLPLLQSMTISANPCSPFHFSSLSSFQNFLISHCKQIQFLDGKWINNQTTSL